MKNYMYIYYSIFNKAVAIINEKKAENVKKIFQKLFISVKTYYII